MGNIIRILGAAALMLTVAACEDEAPAPQEEAPVEAKAADTEADSMPADQVAELEKEAQTAAASITEDNLETELDTLAKEIEADAVE